MASSEIITTIIDLTRDMLLYMMPIIALMSGLTLIISFLFAITLGQSRKIFRG